MTTRDPEPERQAESDTESAPAAPEVVEKVVEQVSDDADRAEAAADSAEESARSAAVIAEQIDDATDLVVDEATPAPYVPVEPSTQPTLLRHTPFNIGFFGAFGALVAIFLAQQLLSISSIWCCW